MRNELGCEFLFVMEKNATLLGGHKGCMRPYDGMYDVMGSLIKAYVMLWIAL